MEKICVIQGDCLQDVLASMGKLMPQDFLQKNVVLSPLSKRAVESHLFSAQKCDVLFATETASLFGFLRHSSPRSSIIHANAKKINPRMVNFSFSKKILLEKFQSTKYKRNNK